MILTLDLGTHRVKAALWGEGGLVGTAGAALATTSPVPGASEQDGDQWWPAAVAACGSLAGAFRRQLGAVDVVACTGARQTFGLFDAAGTAVGPAMVWSDGRAAGDGRPASVADRLSWMAEHRADDLARSAWIVGPRDRVAWRMTGTVATDPTMASVTDCYRADGAVDDRLDEAFVRRLPVVVPSGEISGTVDASAAGELGIPGGVPLVIGAGDRQCEVLGTGATGTRPMVSWGTTANVSLPVSERPLDVSGVVPTRSADGGWQLEGGVSAAGSLLAWFGSMCGRSTSELARLAADSPPGARGVIAAPWLGGARAPWWRPEAGAGFVGVDAGHGPGDLARALFEAVARDIGRCLAAMRIGRPPGPEPVGLWLTGGGAAIPVWREVLTGVVGLPGRRRKSGQGASAGAALLGARAIGLALELDDFDPVLDEHTAPGELVRRYGDLAGHADRTAALLLEVGNPPPCR